MTVNFNAVHEALGLIEAALILMVAMGMIATPLILMAREAAKGKFRG